MANATTETKVTASSKLLELLGTIPTILKSGDVEKITTVRDGIIVLRALIGSGGTVELTDGTKVKVSDSGVTQTFDDLLGAMIDNGMIDAEKVPTVLKRDKAGRPRKEVKEVNASIFL